MVKKMINIRKSCFETNSSSTHVITLGTDEKHSYLFGYYSDYCYIQDDTLFFGYFPCDFETRFKMVLSEPYHKARYLLLDALNMAGKYSENDCNQYLLDVQSEKIKDEYLSEILSTIYELSPVDIEQIQVKMNGDLIFIDSDKLGTIRTQIEDLKNFILDSDFQITIMDYDEYIESLKHLDF